MTEYANQVANNSLALLEENKVQVHPIKSDLISKKAEIVYIMLYKQPNLSEKDKIMLK